MTDLSTITFQRVFIPLLVLLVIVFWNVLSNVSYCSGILKLVIALSLSMLCLVAIHDTGVEKVSWNVEEITIQAPSESALAWPQEAEEDFLTSIFTVIWLMFIIAGAMLCIIADNVPLMEMINNFMKSSKKPSAEDPGK